MSLIPEIIDQESLIPLMAVANLTTKQQRILIALAHNITCEIPRTDKVIAEEIGTSVQYIWECRHKPEWAQAMAAVVCDMARGTQDKAFRLLMKHAEKDPGSVKTWLQIGGVHIDRRQNVNINAHIDATAPIGTPESAIESSCQKFIGIGYDLERYIAEITETWTRLKVEGV